MTLESLIISMSLFALCACTFSQAAYENAVPARKAALSREELAEVKSVVAGAIGQATVRIRSDVFARNHILGLEPRRGLQGGLILTPPRIFHLLTDGDVCYLEDRETGIRYTLTFSCTAPQGEDALR